MSLQPDDNGLVTIEDAAVYLGMDVKRLRGRVWKNLLGDPIGCAKTGKVYAFWIERMKKASEANGDAHEDAV